MIVSKPSSLALSSALLLLGGGAFLIAPAGCSIKRPKEQHFYDQHIQPIFTNFCVNGTSPCHRIDPATGSATGNLDLSSFEAVQKRRDVLRTYGSYPQPLLLLKALAQGSVQIPYQQNLYPSEIRHNGGNVIAPTSDAYYELKRWLDNGANRDGQAPPLASAQGRIACNQTVPADQPAVDAGSAAYQTFLTDVQPKILESCAFGTCHSSPQSDFYMTCGLDDAQKQYNFGRAANFVTAKGIAVEQSEILLRPLAPAAGGVSHTGGVFFDSRDNDVWLKWKAWALQVQDSPAYTLTRTAGQQFFEDNVMPKLLQRGCALEGCHSPDGFNDFRLRSGAQGFFSPMALKRNYETTLKEFMALDSVDVRQSRAVRKTIFTSSGGMTHRAGPVLDGVDAMNRVDSATPCPVPFDPATANAFCVFQQWHALERQARAADVSPMAPGDVLPLAFVARPPNGDTLLQFDTYQGGADLKLADAVLGASGRVTSVGNVRSALTGCAGLTGDVDVRGPEWSYDGTQLVFAARPGAASGFDLWLLDLTLGTGGACRRLSNDDGRMQGLVRVHNFDPVFAPDGSLVFASTRAGTLTLKNVLPNADLFRVGPDLDFTAPEQMTWLLNSEIGPAFMQDGRVSFTAE